MRNRHFKTSCDASGAAWVQSQAGAEGLPSRCTPDRIHEGGPLRAVRGGTVAIERQRVIGLLDAPLKVAGVRHRLCQMGIGNRQSRVERKRLACQSFSRTDGFAQAGGLEGVSQTGSDAREAGIGCSEARLEDGSLFEKIPCCLEMLSAIQSEVPKATVVRLPRVEIGRLMQCSLLFGIHDGRSYGRRDCGGDFVLNGKNVR